MMTIDEYLRGLKGSGDGAQTLAEIKTAALRCNEWLRGLDVPTAGAALSFVLAEFIERNDADKRDAVWPMWRQHVGLILNRLPEAELEDEDTNEHVFQLCMGLLTSLRNDGDVANVLTNLIASFFVLLPAEDVDETWRLLRAGVDQNMAAQSRRRH